MSCTTTFNCPVSRTWELAPKYPLTFIQQWGMVKANFLRFENDYKGHSTIEWTRANSHIPIAIATFYLAFVYFGPRLMQNHNAMRLKPLFATWNLCLSLFSVIGSFRLIPPLVAALMDPHKGLQYTVCADPTLWVMDGPAGLWLTLFIFSKVPELIDTAFLVVRKKPVIFLHWYHHFTVMLYCWHALHTTAAPGIWFAAMNFFVHSVMYGYYFATNVGLFKYVRPIAPVITTLQIAQMVGGTAIMLKCAWESSSAGAGCSIEQSNLAMGLGMYLSYFALFAVFFIGKYCGGGGGGGGSSGPEPAASGKNTHQTQTSPTTVSEVATIIAGTRKGIAVGGVMLEEARSTRTP